MPIISSSYQAPLALRNGYVQSIYPTLFRSLDISDLQRERIETSDGDFLDLDWYRQGSQDLVIVSHGLEGHSRRPYVLGIMQEAHRVGWDSLSWNFRTCSGTPNRLPRTYHSAATDDLHRVVAYAHQQGYRRIHLVGFSMGGNLSLVYASRDRAWLPSSVVGMVVFSVPCDLRASAYALAKRRNRIFMWRFLRDLKVKMATKSAQYPELVSLDGYDQIRTFREFDDRYTAPLHGFRDAHDYWQQASAGQYLHELAIPTLIVNALDDPFLAPSCYPQEQARVSSRLWLEMPKHGGHVGFVTRSGDGHYWSERRALAFLQALDHSSE
ncbi:MAG: alpha/beta fold hydrolase [Bacterioplanes sp.]|nr:alpha/beta fold hydrolase [Bacterioplanes sp.]